MSDYNIRNRKVNSSSPTRPSSSHTSIIFFCIKAAAMPSCASSAVPLAVAFSGSLTVFTGLLSTTGSSSSFFRFGSSSRQWKVCKYLFSRCSFFLGMLLSPGFLNQDTIAFNSLALHVVRSVLFAQIEFTLLFVFSNCCHLHSITSILFCSLLLLWSIPLWCTLPLVSSRDPALKAMPAVIRRQRLNFSSLCAMMSSRCSSQTCSKALSRIFCLTILSIIVFAMPPSKLRRLGSTFSLLFIRPIGKHF